MKMEYLFNRRRKYEAWKAKNGGSKDGLESKTKIRVKSDEASDDDTPLALLVRKKQRRRRKGKQEGSKAKGQKCKLCGDTFLRVEHHMKLHETRPPVDCDLCNKTFPCMSRLIKHKGDDHGLGYTCDVCQKTFRSKDGLRIHAFVHSTDRPFVCDICGFSAKRKGGLDAHMMRHSGNWVCRCETCGKGFNSHTKLNEHLNTHTGEKPFICDQCGMAYSNSNTLWGHARKCHPETFKSLLRCKPCRKVFAKTISYESHMAKYHSKGDHFKCEFCTKTFNKEANLTIHRRTHTNERPFSCDLCGGAYTARKFLMKHMAVHREKNYKCRYCYKKFVKRDGWTSHEQRHHIAHMMTQS